MTLPTYPSDNRGRSIPLLLPGSTVTLSASDVSSRVQLPDGARVVRVATDGKVYIKFGGGTVSATTSDIMLPVAGVELFYVGGNTYIAAICEATQTAKLTITVLS